MTPEEKTKQARRNRRKGKGFEREIANQLKEIFGPTVRRGFQFRNNQDKVADVLCPMIHIECKNTRKPNPVKALEQAEETCPNDKIPVSICKRQFDPDKTTITLYWKDFFKILKEYISIKGLIGGGKNNA